MNTITTFIINELTLALEHEPTQAELHALSEHLATQHIKYLVELDNAIHQWVQNTTNQCSWCGQRWLPSEMIHGINEHFCSDKCKSEWQDEHGGC